MIWGLPDDLMSRLRIEEREDLRPRGPPNINFCPQYACGRNTAREAEADQLAAAGERVGEERLTPEQRISRDTRLDAAEQRRADRMR